MSAASSLRCFKMINSFLFTQDEMKFIKRSYKKHSAKDVTALVNQRFSKDYKVSQVKAIISRGGFKSGRTGRFEKGCQAAKGNKRKSNSGTFKKGHNSNKKSAEGTERVLTNGSIEVKRGNEWIGKQRYVWEQHNGAVPEGCIIRFINGINYDINNLFMVTKAESLHLNKLQYSDQPEDLKESTLLIAKIIAKTHALGKV